MEPVLDQVVTPRLLVPGPAHFANRRGELALLDQALPRPTASGPAMVLLKGTGGVGKTALALHWLRQREERFPGGQLFAELTDPAGEPVDPADVLGQYLHALGVPTDRIPHGLAGRAVLFRSLTADRSMAMLLDDAVSAAQVRALRPVSPTSMVLVTSRRLLLGLVADGAHVVPVEPLDTGGALELLTQRMGADRIAAENREAVALVELCGGLPIALSVAAALAVARPRRPLERTVDELREEQERLSVLSADQDISVRGAFDMSYVDLSVIAANTYRAMALGPGADFGVHLVAAATGLDVRVARTAVNELVDASLLDEPQDGRFRFHDLIRAHARERAFNEDSAPAREVTLRRIIEWYLLAAQTAGPVVMPARPTLPRVAEADVGPEVIPAELADHRTALAWLERERHNLGAAVRSASHQGWYRLTYALADAMQPLFILHNHYHVAVEIDELGARAAVALGDHDAETNMRKRLARAHSRLGDFDQAQGQIGELLRATRAREDRQGEASALKSQGILFAESGQLDSAVEAFQRTVAILADLGRDRALGLTLINLGETLLAMNRPEDAVAQLESARLLLSAPTQPDRYNASRATIRLGRAHARNHNDTTARQLLTAALATMVELDAPAEQIQAHLGLAEVLRRAGDEPAALEHETAAARLAENIAAPAD